MNWSLILICIGVFNGLMLSILFLRSKHAHVYLGLFLLAHSIILLKYLGNAMEVYVTYHIVIAMGEILEWLVGPLLYFYIFRYLHRPIRHAWVHFVPVLIYVFILVPLHIYLVKNPDLQLFELHIQRSDFNYLVIPKIIQSLFYFSLILPLVVGQRWLSLILWVFFAETAALSLFYFQFLFTKSDIFSDLMVSSIMVIAVNVIAISGLMKSPIFGGGIPANKAEQPAPSFKEPENHSHLRPVFEKVKGYVEESEIYKNQHVKLSDLAGTLSIPEKQLSQAVNECFGDNINSFINSYRIRLAEAMLVDPAYSYLTIDAIAEECGFSNKVSFYKAFKRTHHMSPKEYKEIQNSLKSIVP